MLRRIMRRDHHEASDSVPGPAIDGDLPRVHTPGSMSLVNWRPWKLQSMERASACASVVLPSLTTSRFPRIVESSAVSSSVGFLTATDGENATA